MPEPTWVPEGFWEEAALNPRAGEERSSRRTQVESWRLAPSLGSWWRRLHPIVLSGSRSGLLLFHSSLPVGWSPELRSPDRVPPSTAPEWMWETHFTFLRSARPSVALPGYSAHGLGRGESPVTPTSTDSRTRTGSPGQPRCAHLRMPTYPRP